MLKQKYFLAGIFILSAEKQPIKLSWRKIECLRKNWNHKKVYRVYKNMHYEKRVRLKKCFPASVKTSLGQPSEPNTTWSMDFVGDILECRRKFRVLNIMDDSDKVAVSQKVSMSFPARRVKDIGKGNLAEWQARKHQM